MNELWRTQECLVEDVDHRATTVYQQLTTYGADEQGGLCGIGGSYRSFHTHTHKKYRHHHPDSHTVKSCQSVRSVSHKCAQKVGNGNQQWLAAGKWVMNLHGTVWPGGLDCNPGSKYKSSKTQLVDTQKYQHNSQIQGQASNKT